MNDSIKDFVAGHHKSTRVSCPVCSDGRKKNNEQTLGITVKADGTVYHCFHCNIKGSIEKKAPFFEKYLEQDNVISIPTQLNSEKEIVKKFFKSRGVTFEDCPLPVTSGKKYFAKFKEEREAIGFLYGDPDEPYAIKWRSLEGKAFTQDGNAKDFYGIKQLPEDPNVLIIVEGECDAIALASIGIHAVSCPNGAPQKVSNRKVDPSEDGKFNYIWEARDIIDEVEKVILATDADEAGEALQEEIARRIGRAKCWSISLPEGCKDVTDVLLHHGEDILRSTIENPTPLPLKGVYGASDYASEVQEIYREGLGRGTSTGLETVDELFTVAPGQLTIVTGLPNSGKSEFLDQIMINLAQNNSWKFAVASFENPPAFHIAKLAEKITQRPFFKGLNPRMDEDQLNEAFDFIDKHFVFLDSRDGAVSTIDSLIERFKQSVMRLGVRGIIIDPYNMIEREGEDETSSVSLLLTKLTTFCKAHDLHCWFVAHPAKMYPKEDGSYTVPTGMSISGSAHFFNKADIGATVHRGKDGVEIHCWKCRFKWVGQQGMTILDYDVPTGIYSDRPVEKFDTSFETIKAKPHWMDGKEADF